MFDWIYFLAPNLKQLGGELLTCLGQTFTMIGVSGILSWILGILVGVLLVTCRPGGILENRPLFTIFDRGIDIIRSIPFIILIVLLIPLSRFLVGTGSGVTGSFVALVFGTVPFFARQIESVLSEIDHGLVEASAAMGFSPRQIMSNHSCFMGSVSIFHYSFVTGARRHHLPSRCAMARFSLFRLKSISPTKRRHRSWLIPLPR